jgi:hypothetical protein
MIRVFSSTIAWATRFYCNASNGFAQKCLVCTTDLSHVTDFRETRGWSLGSREEGNCSVFGRAEGDHEES